MARITKWFSFSNVIACMALFVALGGSVYAAGKISGKQIKRNSIPGNRIKPKGIPASRIKLKSLTGRQVKANSLTGTQINEKTLTGVNAAALAGVQYQTMTSPLPTNRGSATSTAGCPPGLHVLGGGATVSSVDHATVSQNGPSPSQSGWTATGYAWRSGITMTVTAICAAVDKPGGPTASGGTTTTPGGPDYFPAG